jgi:hypothetical protein
MMFLYLRITAFVLSSFLKHFLYLKAVFYFCIVGSSFQYFDATFGSVQFQIASALTIYVATLVLFWQINRPKQIYESGNVKN